MKLKRIDHVGIIVNDLAAATAFFVAFGFKAHDEMEIEAPWLDRVVGLTGVHSVNVYLETPGGDANIELSQFIAPPDANGLQPNIANTLGIRHICFNVENLDALVAKLEKHGAELVGAIEQYEDSIRLCYLRGPEGIILELAENLK